MNIGTMTPPPQHVIAISEKAVTLPVIQYSHELDTAWNNRNTERPLDPYNKACMLSAAFLAGYMQGKREERAKQQHKKAVFVSTNKRKGVTA